MCNHSWRGSVMLTYNNRTKFRYRKKKKKNQEPDTNSYKISILLPLLTWLRNCFVIFNLTYRLFCHFFLHDFTDFSIIFHLTGCCANFKLTQSVSPFSSSRTDSFAIFNQMCGFLCHFNLTYGFICHFILHDWLSTKSSTNSTSPLKDIARQNAQKLLLSRSPDPSSSPPPEARKLGSSDSPVRC